MELDDLKTAWRTLDERVNASIALNLRVQTEIRLDKARASLRRQAWQPRLEVAVNAVGAALLGAFLAGHVRDVKFLVPAAALQAGAVLLVIAGARQLAALARVDYTESVVEIQQQLARVYVMRLRVNRWILMTAPIIWVPLAIVLAEGLLGWDLYRAFGAAWIVASLIAGLAATGVAWWLFVRYADRFQRSPFWRRLADELAGRSLAEAAGIVRSLDEFARD